MIEDQREAIWTILPGRYQIDTDSRLFIDNFVNQSQTLLRSIITMRLFEEGVINKIGDQADMTITDQPTTEGGTLVSYLYPEKNLHLLSVEFKKEGGIDIIFNEQEQACKISLMK